MIGCAARTCTLHHVETGLRLRRQEKTRLLRLRHTTLGDYYIRLTSQNRYDTSEKEKPPERAGS